MASFEEALPGLQAQYPNIMDALAAYNQSQQQAYFAPATTPAAPATTPAGIAALPSATPLNIAVPTNLPTDVAGLYTSVLGRDPLAGQQPDTTGFNYWQKEIGSDGITADEYKRFYEAGIPELISSAYKTVLGRDIPATDTGPAYYTEQLRSGALTPQTLRSALVSGATGTDILPAQAYDILGSSGIYQALENPRYATALEQKFGLDPGTLTPTVKSSDLATKNLQELQSILQTSGFNKFQEADRVSGIAKNLYGLTDEQTTKLEKDLISGKSTDPLLKEIYQSYLTGKPNEELQQKLVQDAATKAPDSPFFQANPFQKVINTPIGEIKRGEETSNTYGVDPRTNLPILHKKAFDNILDKDGEVFIGGMQDMTDNIRHQYVGADPHSKWQGALARGTGVFGVTASKDDISDFSRIEKELNKLGGVQRQVDPETGSAMDVVYVEQKDPDNPERTYKVPVTAEQFFAMQMAGDKYYGAEDPSTVARYTRNFESTSAYDYYKNTKARLDEIAKDTYKDPSKTPQYKDIKDIYEDLNNKYKDLYLWQGRTDTLDPAAAKTLGIDDVKENSKHASILYTSANDKLVPVKVQRVYDFEDPNTSSGFFGDLFNNIMEVLSIKPISMALGAYLTTPGIDALTGAATPAPLSAATRSVANLLPSGLTGILPTSITPDMIARSIISSGIGALPAGTRGFEDFAKAFGINLAGSGVQLGASALGAPSIVSRGLGTATTAALSDRDIGDALTRLATSEGISALLQNVPTGDFDKNLLAAFAPAILSGRLTPADLMLIAQVTNPPPKK
jgi:hypothetical protein